MKIKFSVFVLAFFLFSLTLAAANRPVEQLTSLAVSSNATEATAAVSELRQMGPAGLSALFAKYAVDIKRFGTSGEPDARWKSIANALDTVAMQRDVYTSQLYWYTDLDEAKRAAKAQHKPILSLRLLGNLNEEFSCANSRLFRATLYSNTEISKYLRNNYILHWQTVRPAPRITIDFGDGRKIERTITGNSIHYILDENGTIIDAIPGLYSKAMFLQYIASANEMVKSIRQMTFAQQVQALRKFRNDNFDAIVAKRVDAIKKAGVEMTETKSGSLAILAAPVAVSKAMVSDEYTILRMYDDFAKFEPSINFDDWKKLAEIYSPAQPLDANSVAFIRRQNAKTGLTAEEFKSLFARLDSFVAIDTTRNEFLLHTQLYQWINRGRLGDLETFNARVYDAIFQTPNTDKWLGLYSNDVYTALDGNGIID